jgi:Branched-chain amino acid transport protein (AzlD)
MTAAWVTIAVLAAGTIVIKAAGPLAIGRRSPSPRVARVIALVAPSLLAALVVYETVNRGTGGIVADARLAGLAAAALALTARLPLIVVVALAAGAAAGVRALG